MDQKKNIIVYGVRRTGTSLMVELLSQSNNYSINKNDHNAKFLHL